MNRKEKFAIPVDAMVMIREPGFVVVARLNILEKINQIFSKPESFCFRLAGALYIILPHYWCQLFAFFHSAPQHHLYSIAKPKATNATHKEHRFGVIYGLLL